MAGRRARNARIQFTNPDNGEITELPLEPNDVAADGRIFQGSGSVTVDLGGVDLGLDTSRFDEAIERIRRLPCFSFMAQAWHTAADDFRVTIGRRLDDMPGAEAKARARDLLLSHLTDDQRAEIEVCNCFTVTGSNGGRYRIDAGGGSYNVVRLSNEGQETVKFCLDVDGGVPVADQALVQKLLLESDELRFCRIANKDPVTLSEQVGGFVGYFNEYVDCVEFTEFGDDMRRFITVHSPELNARTAWVTYDGRLRQNPDHHRTDPELTSFARERLSPRLNPVSVQNLAIEHDRNCVNLTEKFVLFNEVTNEVYRTVEVSDEGMYEMGRYVYSWDLATARRVTVERMCLDYLYEARHG